mmetsp:Transcript_33453/g.60334  ORF Transcript_33453/g.60334 Transcript_33453/m.60334 type:complete len:511 (+) Transcript_33453:124-1656(+)
MGRTMAEPSMETPLMFDEVRRLVEASSTAIRLELDAAPNTDISADGAAAADECGGGAISSTAGIGAAVCRKGRYLVARRALKAGEIMLSESPLFRGCTDGAQSRRAYVEDFAAPAIAAVKEGWHTNFCDEDCMHPCSPLVDCIAGMVLAKEQALHAEDKTKRSRSRLRLRQLAALARTAVPGSVPDDCAKDMYSVLRPELREITSEEEMHEWLVAITSNRFGSHDAQLDLMFAGSMFEHSCFPNCFAGTWKQKGGNHPRAYRALRDVSEGEALSIDYLSLPPNYFPAADRAEILSAWGFSCTCPRCTSLPELTRAFVCNACGAPELCPVRPGAASAVELQCRSCNHVPEAAYVEQCLRREAELRPPIHDEDGSAAADGSEAGPLNVDLTEVLEDRVISRFHYLAFQAAWTHVQEGLEDQPSNLATFRLALEALIAAIVRLFGDTRHPQLLDLYHTMAALRHGYLEEQQRFLILEHEVLEHMYPEEAARQDEEIMKLVQGRGGPAPLSAMD